MPFVGRTLLLGDAEIGIEAGVVLHGAERHETGLIRAELRETGCHVVVIAGRRPHCLEHVQDPHHLVGGEIGLLRHADRGSRAGSKIPADAHRLACRREEAIGLIARAARLSAQSGHEGITVRSGDGTDLVSLDGEPVTAKIADAGIGRERPIFDIELPQPQMAEVAGAGGKVAKRRQRGAMGGARDDVLCRTGPATGGAGTVGAVIRDRDVDGLAVGIVDVECRLERGGTDPDRNADDRAVAIGALGHGRSGQRQRAQRKQAVGD